MKRSHGLPLSIKLGHWHKRWLYTAGGALTASGIGWLIAHFFFSGSGGFDDAPNVSESWWLRLHGAAAMGFLIAFGSLLPGHIARAWQLRRNYRSGFAMLAGIAILVATAYALYYFGDEQTRPWISMVHWVLGLIIALGMPFHIYLGRQRKVTKYQRKHLEAMPK